MGGCSFLSLIDMSWWARVSQTTRLIAGILQFTIVLCIVWLDSSNFSPGSAAMLDPHHTFPLSKRSFRSSHFSTTGSIFDSSLTEASCDCYDGGCSLHLRNAVVRRTSKNRFLVSVVKGSDRPRIASVLKSCKNGFPYCDTSQGSVLCAGLLYSLDLREQSSELQAIHVLVTVRALAYEFYHGLTFPRGVLLNWALREKALRKICGLSDCGDRVKSKTVVLSDFHRPDALYHEKRLVMEVMDLLKFPEPDAFSVGSEIAASWITIENRILQPEGEIAEMVFREVERMKENAAALPEKIINTVLFLKTKTASKADEDTFQEGLVASLSKNIWNVSIEYSDDMRLHDRRFLRQVAYISAQSKVIFDDGPHATWILFAAVKSTWLMLFRYRIGYDLPNIRLHIRSWLLHRQCRLIALLYWDNPEAQLDALYKELTRPYVSGVTVISNSIIVRCNDVLSCGNSVDHTLLVEHRAMYESGGYP